MKRLLPKSLVDQAKEELKENFISRIIKNVNEQGCWHLKSVDRKKIVDFICHFSERGTKKIFFKAKRLAFEYCHGELIENFAVYPKCADKYCINPKHHFATTPSDYIKCLELTGAYKRKTGYKRSAETIAKIAKANLGKRASKETKLKMRLAKLGTKKDPELVAITAAKFFQGEKNPLAKLTEKEVLEIRSLKNIISSRKLAAHYPVTHSHIRNIQRENCWTHL